MCSRFGVGSLQSSQAKLAPCPGLRAWGLRVQELRAVRCISGRFCLGGFLVLWGERQAVRSMGAVRLQAERPSRRWAGASDRPRVSVWGALGGSSGLFQGARGCLFPFARLTVGQSLGVLAETYSQDTPWLHRRGEGCLEDVASLRLRDQEVARKRRERPTPQRGQPEQRRGVCQGPEPGGGAGALRAREMEARRLGASHGRPWKPGSGGPRLRALGSLGRIENQLLKTKFAYQRFVYFKCKTH